MRYSFMFDTDLRVAYNKSNEVISEKDIGEDVLSVQKVTDIVAERVGCEISIDECSFLEISKETKQDISKCGAMMWTELTADGKKKANIVLNNDNDVAFKRFSLMHELGHLMTGNSAELFSEEEKYVVSTHIDYSITSISPEKYKKDDYLFYEQQANVFALRVLMPWDIFKEILKKLDSISKVAKYFGVTEDAVISRIMLVR